MAKKQEIDFPEEYIQYLKYPTEKEFATMSEEEMNAMMKHDEKVLSYLDWIMKYEYSIEDLLYEQYADADKSLNHEQIKNKVTELILSARKKHGIVVIKQFKCEYCNNILESTQENIEYLVDNPKATYSYGKDGVLNGRKGWSAYIDANNELNCICLRCRNLKKIRVNNYP